MGEHVIHPMTPYFQVIMSQNVWSLYEQILFYSQASIAVIFICKIVTFLNNTENNKTPRTNGCICVHPVHYN